MCDRAAVAADAERQDVRMLEEQQHVADAAGAAILDERALQRERLGVRARRPSRRTSRVARPTRRSCVLPVLPLQPVPPYQPSDRVRIPVLERLLDDAT